jgi:protocatechuate 3,4-dioxygenase beta subunit
MDASRRTFLGSTALGLGAAFWLVPGAFAEELLRTPRMTEGPFYPDKLPLDTDNDLIIVNKSLTPATGEITHLTGRILDGKGSPVKNAVIEIWQCDANAVYLHSRDSGSKKYDKNFQGFGKFETNAKGEYRFRTIKPVPYPGRPAPHIHFKVKKGDRTLLTSQIFIAGHAGNARDGVFRGLSDPLDREVVQTEFKKLKGSKTGELTATFDVVLGRTPDEEKGEQKKSKR